MLKDRDRWIIWPVYIDSKKSKTQGRKVSKKNSVASPTLKEIEKVANMLNLSPEIEKNKKYPKSWWEESGRISVNKTSQKSVILKQISQKIKEIRNQK